MSVPPRIAYLILAHDNPRHLARLVGRLTTLQATCFVHVDRKSPLAPFAAALAGSGAVLLEDRLDVRWARFSMVRATRLLMRRALADARQFSRFVLLSGSDYPIHSTAAIEAFFARHPAAEFIESAPMTATTGKPLARLARYRPDEPAYRSVLRKVRERAGLSTGRDYRAALGGLAPHSGSQWWALTRAACDEVEAFEQAHPALVRFFAATECPDEMYFQTILANSALAAQQRDALTYTDWIGNAASPTWLTLDHMDRLRAAGAPPPGGIPRLFARKCPEPSDAMVAAIEAMIASRPPGGAIAD